VRRESCKERLERRRSKSWRRKRPCTLVRIQKTERRSKARSEAIFESKRVYEIFKSA
jgi:hypothetical protein